MISIDYNSLEVDRSSVNFFTSNIIPPPVSDAPGFKHKKLTPDLGVISVPIFFLQWVCDHWF